MIKKLNVLLIQPPLQESVDKEYLSIQTPINLAYIASSLEQEGANVKIIDFCVEKFEKNKLIFVLDNFKPTIVGFTSMTPSIYIIKQIVEIVKKHNKNILTLLGGVHISALPQKTLEEIPYIDIGIIGEGEETIKEIYKKYLSNKSLKNIKGTVCRIKNKIKINPKRDLIENLDKLPFPARHLLKLEKYNKSHVSRGFSRKYLRIMELFTSRGCPNQCIFCASHINYGYSLRFRSYENIISEIEFMIKKYKINHVTIMDDTFTINRPLVKKLCKYFKEKRLTWNSDTRVNTVDFELLTLMKKSGCKKISFGVESGSPRILKLVKKNITIDQIKNAFRWAKKAGIKYIEGTFILGSHPDEKLEDIEKTKKLIFELMPDFISLSIICPFPGTELYEIMNKNKLLEKNLDWSKFTFINNTPPFKHLNHLTSTQLLKIQKEILKKYHSSPKYIFNQIKKIRSINELLYFSNLGFYFISEFLVKRK